MQYYCKRCPTLNRSQQNLCGDVHASHDDFHIIVQVTSWHKTISVAQPIDGYVCLQCSGGWICLPWSFQFPRSLYADAAGTAISSLTPSGWFFCYTIWYYLVHRIVVFPSETECSRNWNSDDSSRAALQAVLQWSLFHCILVFIHLLLAQASPRINLFDFVQNTMTSSSVVLCVLCLRSLLIWRSSTHLSVGV